MQAAGVYERVRPKLVIGENIAQTMQFVQSGAADAGIVAVSLTRAPNMKGKGRLFEIPASTYPRLEQGGTILKGAVDVDAARAFRGFLVSADGQAILKQYGFSVPDR
jgi:molybdate transport system substrate-binding protein